MNDQYTIMPTKMGLGAIGLLLCGLSSSVRATELIDIESSSASGDRTDIMLTFDQSLPAPNGYAIASPARISLDLMGVSSGLSSK